MAKRKETQRVQIGLRLREELRAKLESSARKRDVSLNTEVVDRLERSFEVEQEQEWAEANRKMLAETTAAMDRYLRVGVAMDIVGERRHQLFEAEQLALFLGFADDLLQDEDTFGADRPELRKVLDGPIGQQLKQDRIDKLIEHFSGALPPKLAGGLWRLLNLVSTGPRRRLDPIRPKSAEAPAASPPVENPQQEEPSR